MDCLCLPDAAEGHSQTTNAERERLAVQARVINHNLSLKLTATDSALRGIIADLPSWRRSPAFSRTASPRLRAIADVIPGLRALHVLDAEGRVLASSRENMIGLDFSGREYFRTARSSFDPSLVILSPPFVNVSGTWGVSLARVIAGPGGEFTGVVTANLDEGYFATLLGSVNYAPDMWTAVAHGDS